MPSKDIAPERIAGLLKTRVLGRSLSVVACTGSTNDDARRAAAGGAPDGHVILADQQTGGRGSHGRRWESPSGTDLYFSIIARPFLALADIPFTTLATGLGLAEAIERESDGHRAGVKWPNDVWLEGKKCAGVLVETSTFDGRISALVIGVGINVNRQEFSTLADGATSVAKARGSKVDRASLFASALERIEAWIGRLSNEGREPIVQALMDRLVWRGRRVRIGDVEGVLLGVADSGAIQLKTSTGVQEMISGRLEMCG